MWHCTRSVLALSVLTVLSGLAAGCKSGPPQPSQTPTAGLRIDVLKASKTDRKQRVDVRVRVWNDHEQRINFDLGNVRLLFNGREVAPTATMTKDPNPDVQQKSPRTFDWAFEVGDIIGEGTYPIEIRDIKRGDMPLGESASFTINL